MFLGQSAEEQSAEEDSGTVGAPARPALPRTRDATRFEVPTARLSSIRPQAGKHCASTRWRGSAGLQHQQRQQPLGDETTPEVSFVAFLSAKQFTELLRCGSLSRWPAEVSSFPHRGAATRSQNVSCLSSKHLLRQRARYPAASTHPLPRFRVATRRDCPSHTFLSPEGYHVRYADSRGTRRLHRDAADGSSSGTDLRERAAAGVGVRSLADPG
ncbi:hypothetical protein MRX96_050737 [Rhipicephalus microplus]